MIMQRTTLAREALDKSLEVRESANLDFGTPIDVYDLCTRLQPNIRVLFTDYSMEGCYIRGQRPLIKISALRPLARRMYNTAHELGHHVFGHGSRIDELQTEGRAETATDPEEFLAHAFAGYLLMPKIGVRRAFTLRGWQIGTATPEQLFVIACHFGVGYETVLTHLAHGLKEISASRAEQLRKTKLPKIRRNILVDDCSQRLIVADRHYQRSTVDAEVGTHILLPPRAMPERSDLLAIVADLPNGRLFQACRPGLVRVTGRDGWAAIVRVSKYQYSGWCQYRHFEDEEDEDDS